MTDHQRGCEGRTYTCTCGYDDQLVRIGPDAVEQVGFTIWHELGKIEENARAGQLTKDEVRGIATAALAALKGEE